MSASGVNYASATSEVDGNGVTQRSFAYDGLGRLAQVTEQGQVFSYVYDALGCLVLQTGAGKTQMFGCDALGRTTSETMGGETRTWAYDGNGRMTSSSDPLGTTMYGYDTAGRVTQVSYPPSTTNRPSAGTVQYNLTLLRGQSYAHNGGNRISDPRFVYDGSGNLTRIWH